MFRCHVCGSTDAKKEYVNEMFQIKSISREVFTFA